MPRWPKGDIAEPKVSILKADAPFQCACCGGQYATGNSFYYLDSGSKVAADCPNTPQTGISHIRTEDVVDGEDDIEVFSEAQIREARNKMCRSCFLVHRGECF